MRLALPYIYIKSVLFTSHSSLWNKWMKETG